MALRGSDIFVKLIAEHNLIVAPVRNPVHSFHETVNSLIDSFNAVGVIPNSWIEESTGVSGPPKMSRTKYPSKVSRT